AGAGYSQFSLGNLNADKFMVRIRKPVDENITRAFRESTGWPRQLLDLVYIQSLSPTQHILRTVDATRRQKCLAPGNSDVASRCALIYQQIDEFTSRCNSHFADAGVRINEYLDDPGLYYNTAVNYCHYSRFRIFLEEVRLAQYPICAKGAR